LLILGSALRGASVVWGRALPGRIDVHINLGRRKNMADSDKIEGELKEKEGELTGDEIREKQGEAQKAWGDAKDEASDAKDEIEERT
jgi:uncharacterized protein YjbJ (UPF0337 family)